MLSSANDTVSTEDSSSTDIQPAVASIVNDARNASARAWLVLVTSVAHVSGRAAATVDASARTAILDGVDAPFDDWVAQLRQLLIAAVFGLWWLVGRAAAESGSGVCPPGEPAAFCAILRLLNKIQTFFLLFGLGFAVVMLTYAGILIMWDIGGPNSWERAKNVIVRTVIGVVVILTASGFVQTMKQVIVNGGG